MDQIEPLFPIPLLRSPGLLGPALNEAAVAAIRSARIEKNLRSDQLFHTEIANPRDNQLFGEIAALAVPKLVDFGLLLFGEKLRWTVKEMWTNVLETGGSQTLHAHANSFASGILYLTPSHPAPRWGRSMRASTCYPRRNQEISYCFRAISTTKCRETRVTRGSRSPSTPFPTAWIAGATGSTSHPRAG